MKSNPKFLIAFVLCIFCLFYLRGIRYFLSPQRTEGHKRKIGPDSEKTLQKSELSDNRFIFNTFTRTVNAIQSKLKKHESLVERINVNLADHHNTLEKILNSIEHLSLIHI